VHCIIGLATNYITGNHSSVNTRNCVLHHGYLPMQVSHPTHNPDSLQWLTWASRPPQDYWKVSKGPQPNCINQASSLLVAGIINTLTDFAVVLLPIRTIWLLQMPTRQALIIIMLFSFGFVSCGAGILRTYYMYKVTQTWDQTWHSYPVWITSAIELYIGVVSPSLPPTEIEKEPRS
jgi:hypothetical protein